MLHTITSDGAGRSIANRLSMTLGSGADIGCRTTLRYGVWHAFRAGFDVAGIASELTGGRRARSNTIGIGGAHDLGASALVVQTFSFVR